MQCVLLVSCTDSDEKVLLRKILGPRYDPELYFEKTDGGNRLYTYPWLIDNKYYQANITFCHLQSLKDAHKPLLDTLDIGAIIFHCDNDIKPLSSLQFIIEEYKPDVRILSVNTVKDSDSKQSMLAWCIDNEFELVELDPSEDERDDDECEDNFKENYGPGRIMQAIQAHNWPSMSMKEMPKYKPSPKFESILSNEGNSDPVEPENAPLECGSLPSFQLPNLSALSLDPNDPELADKLDGESMESLFQRFSELKRKAQSLSGEERRRYAEKVAMAFWEAIGGDEDEFEGLDEP